MIEVAATCAAPRPSSRRSAFSLPRLSSRPISNRKKHTPKSANRCVRPTSDITAKPCGPSKAPLARKARTGLAPKPLNPGTATANASNTARASRRAPALNNVANASPRKLFSRNAASGARKPHVAAKAPAVNAAAPLHFGRATALLTRHEFCCQRRRRQGRVGSRCGSMCCGGAELRERRRGAPSRRGKLRRRRRPGEGGGCCEQHEWSSHLVLSLPRRTPGSSRCSSAVFC